MAEYIWVDHPFVGQPKSATKPLVVNFIAQKEDEGLRFAGFYDGGQWLFRRMTNAELNLLT